MINGCPKRKSHQDSAPTEKMNQAHGHDKQQTMERQWIPVSGKRAFAPPSSSLVSGPDQHINNTYNVLNELEVENVGEQTEVSRCPPNVAGPSYEVFSSMLNKQVTIECGGPIHIARIEDLSSMLAMKSSSTGSGAMEVSTLTTPISEHDKLVQESGKIPERVSVRSTKRSLRLSLEEPIVAIKTTIIKKDDDLSLGFSIVDYTAPMGYCFMKFFDAPHDFQPAITRVHVGIFNFASIATSPAGFSFPLCGFDKQNWSLNEASSSLQTQVLYFSKYVKYSKVLTILQNNWQHLKVELM